MVTHKCGHCGRRRKEKFMVPNGDGTFHCRQVDYAACDEARAKSR